MTARTLTIHNESQINAKGKLNTPHCKAVLCIDTGEVFSSVTDAANCLGVHAATMCQHLKGKSKSIHKRHYCYLSQVSENLESVFARMRSLTELQEKANKYDAIIAEQETKKRAEEKHKADIEKAEKKYERRKEIARRKEEEAAKAKALEMEALAELNALKGNENEEEECVA